MNYKKIATNDLVPELFTYFIRHQNVTHCWRYSDNQWKIEPVAFTEEWGQEEYKQLCGYLTNTLKTGGIIIGAFSDKNQLKGFVSIEGKRFGSYKQYLDLSALHVSEDVRGQKIGKQLFQFAADFAANQGAEKLYISSHSAVETQAFYSSLGCVDAAEPSILHCENEPYDRQLEYRLGGIA
ncbi:GNAT family N-acetyltransferase [uncultured Enterococcus sp.]|uniref:GNAT family N-acetyltransferase n=1 Tax=uncultured Enterococcus sp. TaxID=167972 RepID=UPI002AA6935D|nr:GNAT family N-acetyltransferase [uncultured Enterococcus sp.]